MGLFGERARGGTGDGMWWGCTEATWLRLARQVGRDRLRKELVKAIRKVEKASETAMNAPVATGQSRRSRSKLAMACEHRDRIELQLRLLDDHGEVA